MSPGVFTRAGESSLTMSEHEERRRKRRVWAIAVAVAAAVIAAVVVVALTVLRARAPEVRINAIDLEAMSVGAGSVSMCLVLDVTVHNPNRASFRYSEGVTRVAYHGEPVGQAAIAAGAIRARGDEYLSVLLLVEAGRVLASDSLPGDIARNRFPVAATTTLAGTVSVLGVFKHHAVATSGCDVTVFVGNATVESFYCRNSVKL